MFLKQLKRCRFTEIKRVVSEKDSRADLLAAQSKQIPFYKTLHINTQQKAVRLLHKSSAGNSKAQVKHIIFDKAYLHTLNKAHMGVIPLFETYTQKTQM